MGSNRKEGLTCHQKSQVGTGPRSTEKEKLFNGQIPQGLFVLHRCDNPSCCNPDHLWIGTGADNMADAKAKGRMHLGDAHGMRKHPELRPTGEKHGRSKLTLAQVKEIVSRRENGEREGPLAAEFGIHRNHVGRLFRAENWNAWLLRDQLASRNAIPQQSA